MYVTQHTQQQRGDCVNSEGKLRQKLAWAPEDLFGGRSSRYAQPEPDVAEAVDQTRYSDILTTTYY